MARESSDPISAAIIATEKEIAGDAWGNEETDALDPTGDRSLEDLGEGLEGQQEEAEVEEVEGEEPEAEETEVEPGKVVAEEQPLAAKPGEQQVDRNEPQGRVPSGKLREANERARVLQAELDTFKTRESQNTDRFTDLSAKLDRALGRIDELSRAPRGEVKPEPAKTEAIPDIFEDPQGFKAHMEKGFQTELAKRDQQISAQRVETSMAIAHAFHKDTFTNAFAAINKLDVNNPDDRSIVARIYNSPNPGEALVSWHKRETTRAEVGDDVVAYRERIAKEARESLAKDPEFRKQLLADMRGEAAAVGEDGRPRNTTRIPQSLARAQGSNVGTGRVDPNAGDSSDQGIADAAWR